jgi:hypothetical protein
MSGSSGRLTRVGGARRRVLKMTFAAEVGVNAAGKSAGRGKPSLSESGKPIRNSPAGIKTISSLTPLRRSNASYLGGLFALPPASLGF